MQNDLIPELDELKTALLENKVSNDIRGIMLNDNRDIEQLIEFNSSDLEKLKKTTEWHNRMK